MTSSVFSSHTIACRYLKLIKRPALRNIHLCLFSQCFGNSFSCVKIKVSDYCNGVSAELEYLSSYEYNFNPVLFIISLEGSHFGSRESIPISHQNSQTSKEILLGSSVLCWHIVKQSSIFVSASVFNP